MKNIKHNRGKLKIKLDNITEKYLKFLLWNIKSYIQYKKLCKESTSKVSHTSLLTMQIETLKK